MWRIVCPEPHSHIWYTETAAHGRRTQYRASVGSRAAIAGRRRATDSRSCAAASAAEIAAQLRPRLTSAERKRIVKRHTANPRAFEAHLKGRYHLAKRTLDGFTKAIGFFEQAIGEDRGYALAYAGLADCWTLLSAGAYGEPSARTMAKAREAAEQALRLDPSNTEVQTALGFVRFRIDWDWSAAESALVRACELSPGHAAAHHRLALLLSALGRHDEALVEIRHAHELDPLSLIISTAVGRVLHFQRRYEDAIEQCRRTLEMDAQFLQARLDLGMACAEAGRHDEAIAQFESALPPAIHAASCAPSTATSTGAPAAPHRPRKCCRTWSAGTAGETLRPTIYPWC